MSHGDFVNLFCTWYNKPKIVGGEYREKNVLGHGNAGLTCVFASSFGTKIVIGWNERLDWYSTMKFPIDLKELHYIQYLGIAPNQAPLGPDVIVINNTYDNVFIRNIIIASPKTSANYIPMFNESMSLPSDFKEELKNILRGCGKDNVVHSYNNELFTSNLPNRNHCKEDQRKQNGNSLKNGLGKQKWGL